MTDIDRILGRALVDSESAASTSGRIAADINDFLDEVCVGPHRSLVNFRSCAPGRMNVKYLMTPSLLMGFCDPTIPQESTIDNNPDQSVTFNEASAATEHGTFALLQWDISVAV